MSTKDNGGATTTRDQAIQFLRNIRHEAAGATIYSDVIEHVLTALDEATAEADRLRRDLEGTDGDETQRQLVESDPYTVEAIRASVAYLRAESAKATESREQHRDALRGNGGARRQAIAARAEVAGCIAMRARLWADALEVAAEDLEDEATAKPGGGT